MMSRLLHLTIALLALSCSKPQCPPVEVIGELTTALDKRAYKAAHIRCYMRHKACLATFAKIEGEPHHGICAGEIE